VSRYLAEDGDLTVDPVSEARALLADLLELRWQGLRQPVAFHPETALAWVQRPGSFHNVWCGDRSPAAECRDVAVGIAFRGRDPLGEAFEANAARILLPLLEHSDVAGG
jgi:exonuclease V gamma subunit